MPALGPLILLARLAAAESGLMAGMVLDRGTAVLVPDLRVILRRWPPTQTAGLFLAFGIFTAAQMRDGIGRRVDGRFVGNGVVSSAEFTL
jgi:hypothetical protein